MRRPVRHNHVRGIVMAQELFTNRLFDDVDDFVAQYREACKTTFAKNYEDLVEWLFYLITTYSCRRPVIMYSI